MKKLYRLAALLLFAGCAGAPQAGDLVNLSIHDRSTGDSLRIYRHQGKLYVAGRPGNRYAVSLQNTSPGRTLTVLSVDGVNAVTGETAAPHQSGYVLEAHAGADIAGWRKNMSEVAAFVFTALPDSYAARTGRPDNVGVIGIAVFREYAPEPELSPQPSMAPLSRNESAAEATGASADRAKASAPEKRLGTGHGRRETSPVQYTDFRRATDTPAEVIQIYYDSYANLVARGVIAQRPAKLPNAFPGQFVPDPQG